MTRTPLTATALWLAVLMGAACGTAEKTPPAQPASTGTLLDRLPRDPLVAAVVSLKDPGASYDALHSLRRLVAAVGGDDLPAFDRERTDEDDSLGVRLREDLLAALGDEVALSIDVPPLDRLASLAIQNSDDVVTAALGRIGLIARTPDAGRLREAVRAILERAGARVSTTGELETARFALPDSVREAVLADRPQAEAVVYGMSVDGLLAIGFDPAWVRDALRSRPEGERLRDGADFRRVLGEFDRPPTSLVYVNLPRLRERVETSTVAQLAIANDPEWKRLWDALRERLEMDVGIAQTTLRSDGRAVHTTHGPAWLPGTADLLALAATWIAPEALVRADRDRQDATVADMRAIAAAIDAYGLDHNAYPEARRMERLKSLLEPRYAENLPLHDGWGRPFGVNSSRTGYALCSGGKDGGDCSFVESGGPTRDVDDAIILQNGAFVQWPERVTAEAHRPGAAGS